MTPSIVCGIDGSAHARAALAVAAALGERLKLRLILVHAVPAPTPDLLLTAPGRLPARPAEIDLLGRDTGDRLLAQAAESCDVAGAERRLEDGLPAERLRAVAREQHADFLVVGSRGAGTFHAAMLGSVSTAVVRDAPCPIVVVPPGMTESLLTGERIVCGVQTGDDGPAVDTATGLSRRLDVPLTVAHVPPTRSEAAAPVPVGAVSLTFDERLEPGPRHAMNTVYRLLERADALNDAARVPYDLRLRRGDPGAALLELAATTRAMLLVVGSRGLGPLRGGLIGSVSRKLVRRATCPVVICRQEEPA